MFYMCVHLSIYMNVADNSDGRPTIVRNILHGNHESRPNRWCDVPRRSIEHDVFVLCKIKRRAIISESTPN